MRFPRWAVPVVLRLLSLAGLTTASGNASPDSRLAIGFALSTSPSPTSQPLALSLGLDFFIQVTPELEVRVPIMPLHLLGKKSWNVYNTSNIEKVRHDEALARAAEEAEDLRLEELEAEHRLRILRGEDPPLLAIEDSPSRSQNTDNTSKHPRDLDRGEHSEKKRKKKHNEDDTDFEMRAAQEAREGLDRERQVVLRKSGKEGDAPITDLKGHIQLFPQPEKDRKAEKHPEVERERERKKKEYEDQYTMRFSNAGGFKKDVKEEGWYVKGEVGEGGKDVDVWGNEDPRRREREEKRLVESDPLAFMKVGARKVRQVEKERKAWREEREREIRELEDADRARRRKRRRDESGEDELDGFRLDGSERRESGEDKERRHRHRHKRRSEASSSHRERGEDDDRDRRHSHKRRRRSE